MCVRAQTSALGIAIRVEQSEKERKAGESQEVEITNTPNTEKDQRPQPNLVEFRAAEVTFRQPTPAEVSVLTFSKLGEARTQAQELSNEFARLLNRGSSLE